MPRYSDPVLETLTLSRNEGKHSQVDAKNGCGDTTSDEKTHPPALELGFGQTASDYSVELPERPENVGNGRKRPERSNS
jgi:hypothetical protein